MCKHRSLTVPAQRDRSLGVGEVGEEPQSQRYGHVSISVPSGVCDVRWGCQDALSHAGGLQKGPQLLTTSYYGNQILLVSAPGDWPTPANRSQLGEEQRNPETTHNYIRQRFSFQILITTCGCWSPGYKIMWSGRQLGHGAHQCGDDPRSRAGASDWWSRRGDLEQHRLQWLETGGDEAHGAAGITWHWQVFPQHPHLKASGGISSTSSLLTSKRNGIFSSQREPQLYYHMYVDFLFSVYVSRGAGKLQQLVGLVHHQGWVELAQFQQVAAENPTEAQRVKRVRRRRKERKVLVCVYLCISLL